MNKLPTFGVDKQNKIEWPRLNDISRLDLNQSIKLKSIYLGCNKNLFEIKLGFTGMAKSVRLNTNHVVNVDDESA